MDYNETLCQAIDIIVAQRISEVNFDRTILCTITDDSKKDKGEYTVTDGSMTFQAFAETDRYYKNNQVYVQIPMGDFSNRKLIVGRHSTEDDEKPLIYVSPMESIVPVRILNSDKTRVGLVANEDISHRDELIEGLTTERLFKTNLVIDYPTTPYNAFYIKADFMCLLQDLLVTSGSYGIKVGLHTKDGDTIALDLNCQKDMFGNPYGYTTYATQSQTYSLNLESDIVAIEAYAYQDNNFYYYDGVDTKPVPVNKQTDNIIIKNIELGFAYDVTKVDDNTVKISTADELTYNNITDTKVSKELVLTWYNKDENNRYLGFTDGEFGTLDQANEADSETYYIRWQHSLNNGQWEDIQATGKEPKLSVTLNMIWATNEYRAIVVFNGRSYTSNTITFKNATGLDDPQGELKMSLALHNVENSSYDSYPLYGPDGIIINPLDSSKRREVYFSYDSEAGGSLESDVLNGATAYFYIPENSTMLATASTTNFDTTVDADYKKEGYTAFVKRFTTEFTQYENDKLNILKNTAPRELNCLGTDYNYDKQIQSWSSGLNAKKVYARSTQSGKKTIMLKESGLSGSDALRAYQTITLIKDKTYSFSTQVYTSSDTNKSATVGLILTYQDGTTQAIGFRAVTTTAGHWVDLKWDFTWSDSLFDTNHALNQNQSWDTLKSVALYLTTAVQDTYTLFDKTYLRESVDDAIEWRPAEGEFGADFEKEVKTFSYCIKKNYNPLFTNNTVILKIVDKNGFVYETSKTFNFSSYGTSGTDYTIVINGKDNVNGWVGSNSFTPVATLYDANHKDVTVNNDAWKWSKYPTQTDASGTLSNDTDGYHVVKAATQVTWVNNPVYISALYPISYSADADYMYQGPTTVIYNNGGLKPAYYDGDLGLYKQSDNSEVACSWSIVYYQFNGINKPLSTTEGDKWKSWGELTQASQDKKPRFKPSSMYLGEECCMVLVAMSGDTVLWRQPLIILQNQYSSGLLNNWDGNLVIDEENNYILSSVMGAGEKDDKNRFTGVLMGTIGKIDSSGETGLFGYDKGAQSFGFKKDGTAFIGKSGVGRIEFDGNSGIIKSAMYNGNTNYKSGSKWDLANGSIVLNGSGGEYFKFNEKNDGKLEMKLSGADIILSNQGDENLTSYIVATANSITQKVEGMAAMDYVGTAPNELRQQSSQDGYYLNIDIPEITNASDIERFSKAIPIFRHGTLLKVTFTKASVNAANTKVKAKIWLNILKVGEGASSDNNGYPIWVNGAVTSTDNPLEWNAGDKLWFKFILTEAKDPEKDFNQGYWVVYDPYGVAQLEIKADNINASVLHKDGTGTGTGFGWNLTDSKWEVGAISNGKLTPTLSVDASGLTVNGNITAKTLTLTPSSTTTINNVIAANSNVKTALSNASTAKDAANEAKSLAEGAQSYAESNIQALDTAVAKHLSGGGSTALGTSYVISPYIGGGYLNIANGSKRVIIDPSNKTGNGYIFQVHNGSEITLGIDSSGSTSMKGAITATGGLIGGWNIYNNSLGILTTRGSNYYGIIFDNYAFTNASRAFAIGKIGYGLTTDKYQKADEYQKALLKGEADWGTPNFQITYDGIVTANYIKANGGQIGDFTIKKQALPSVDTYDAKTYTCLYGSYIEPSAGGTDDTTMYTYITPQGVYIYDTYMESWKFRSWWRIVGNY